MTIICDLCKKENPDKATVCQACGAERRSRVVKGADAKFDGFFKALAGGPIFGFIASYFAGAGVGFLVGVVMFFAMWRTTVKNGITEYFWVRR